MASGAAVALRHRSYAVDVRRAPATAASANPAAIPAMTPSATSARHRRPSSDRAHIRTAGPAVPPCPIAPQSLPPTTIAEPGKYDKSGWWRHHPALAVYDSR